MNEYHKFGLVATIGWNIVLISLTLIRSAINDITPLHVFNDGTGGIGLSIFLLIWSIMWYGIGYKLRKDYISRKKTFREKLSKLDDEKFNKAFRLHYINEQTKILSIVFLTAIPWYLIGHVKGNINKENILIITSIGILSLTCFLIHKKTKEK